MQIKIIQPFTRFTKMNNSTNSTIATPENTNHSLGLIQLCFIYYTLVSVVGLVIILGKWNENNINKFQTYLLKITNENIWLYMFLYILSIMFYTIFISALVCVLSIIWCIGYSFIDLIIGLYECCCLQREEKIVPIDLAEVV
jgi:hypothetical protein